MPDFVDWLEDEMESRGFIQADLVFRGKISPAHVSRIMNRLAEPELDTYIKLADALDLHPITVLRAAGKLPPNPDEPPNLVEWIRLLVVLHRMGRLNLAYRMVRAMASEPETEPEPEREKEKA